MELFIYNDYKDYLSQVIETNKEVRGYKTLLAKAANCQKPYISQVLNSHIHLTPEHAMGLALFWNFTETETEFWIELVHLGRTSFSPLRKKILDRLENIKRERDDFAKRFRQKTLDNHEAQSIYYSSWLYGALHMLVEMPEFQLPQYLSKRLNLSIEIVVEKLGDLEKLGLVKKQEGKFLSTNKFVHLPKESVFNLMNHQNWRDRALMDIQKKSTEGVHYSAIQTLSHKDFLRIKNLIFQFIDEQRKIVSPSEAEDAVCFTCDWFKI